MYYSGELNPESKISNSAFQRKSNKWFQENLNKIQGSISIQQQGSRIDDGLFSTHPKDKSVDEDNKPMSLNCYILPHLKALHLVLFMPSEIKYDSTARTYVNIKPSLFRKILIFSIQLFSTLFYNWTTYNKNLGGTVEAPLSFMFRLMYFMFALLTTTFYYTIFTKGEQIKNLLVSIHDLTAEFQKHSETRLAGCKLSMKIWFVILIFFFDTLLFAIVVDITRGNFGRAINPLAVLTDSTKDAVTGYHLLFQANFTFLEDEWSLAYKVGIGVPYLLLAIYSTSTWIFCFQSICLWGFLFRKFLLVFFDGMTKDPNANSLKFLRQFHKITLVIEDFNLTYGVSVFTGMMASIMYMSNTIWSLTAIDSISDLFIKLIPASAFIIIAVDLLVCSEVNNMANRISFALKLRFQNQKSWIETHAGNMEEVTQGLNMVYYDLLSNLVGVKGYGFFTITYGFVGTVVSMIATYSVLILQFKKNE